MKAGAAKSWAKKHHEKGRRKQRSAFFDEQRAVAEKVVRETAVRLKERLVRCGDEDLPPSWRAASLTREGLLASLSDVDAMIAAKKVPWEGCAAKPTRVHCCSIISCVSLCALQVRQRPVPHD